MHAMKPTSKRSFWPRAIISIRGLLKRVAKDGTYLPAIPDTILDNDALTAYVPPGHDACGVGTAWTNGLSMSFAIVVMGTTGPINWKILVHQNLDQDTLKSNLDKIQGTVTDRESAKYFENVAVVIVFPDHNVSALIMFLEEIVVFFQNRPETYPNKIRVIRHKVTNTPKNGELVVDWQNTIWLDGNSKQSWPVEIPPKIGTRQIGGRNLISVPGQVVGAAGSSA